MANAYSIQRNRQGWIDPTDQDFTMKALMFKQQKYDANQAKVDSVIEKYKSLQLARGVDQKYLQERLSMLVNNINQYGPQDFSSNAVTRSIEHHLGQVLDENVMTAVQETSKIRAYQAEVEKIKEKTPGAYNQLNEAFGLAPAQEYLQDERVGAKIKGSLKYTPFQDIEGEIQKTLLEIQTKAKDGKYQYESQPGQLVEVTVNGKSASELREIALGLMGDKYNSQFTINAWGKYGGFKNLEGATQQVDSYYQNMENAHDKDIAEYRAQLSGGKLSEKTREEYQNKIKALENQKLLIQNNREAFTRDPISGLVAMEKEGVANRLGKSLGLLQTKSMEYKKDDYWFGMQDLNHKIETLNYNKQKDEAEFNQRERFKQLDVDMKTRELEAAAMERARKAQGEGSGGEDSYENRVIQTDGSNDTDQKKLDNNTQVINAIREDRNTLYNTGKTVISSIVDIASGRNTGVDNETKQEAIALINQYKAKYKGNIDVRNLREAQIDHFMDLYTRGDAYENLAFLPIAGERSLTGEYGGRVSLKTQWSNMKDKYRAGAQTYAQQRAAAQAEERRTGKPRHFTENDNFKEYTRRAVSKLTNKQQFALDLKKEDIARLNKMLVLNGGEVKEFDVAAEGGAMTFSLAPNDMIAVKYQSKGKGDNKEALMRTTDVGLIKRDLFLQSFPGMEKVINFQPERKLFTFSSIGTKEFVSPKIGFLNQNSKNYKAYEQEAKALLGGQHESTVFMSKEGLLNVIGGFPNVFKKPEEKAAAQQVVNALTDANILDNLRIVTQYSQSYDGSGRADILVSLVEPRSGKRIFTKNLGPQEGLDEIKNIAERQPQILYGMLVSDEITKMMRTAHTGLRIPEAVQTMINYSRSGGN